MGEGKGVTSPKPCWSALKGSEEEGRSRTHKTTSGYKKRKGETNREERKRTVPLLPSRGIMQIPNGRDGGRRPSLQFPSPQFLFPRIFLFSPPFFRGKERHQKCILRKQPFFHYGSIFRSCETSSLSHVLPGILETRAGAASSLPQNKSHLPTSLPPSSFLAWPTQPEYGRGWQEERIDGQGGEKK